MRGSACGAVHPAEAQTGAKLSDMLLGTVTFVIFAMFLEQMLHLAMRAVFGEKLTGNLWLSALYGGAAAAVLRNSGGWSP